jgi:hypothetical protein
MKICFLIIIFFSSINLNNNKLIGLWSMVPVLSDTTELKHFLNFKKDGRLTQIKDNETSSFQFSNNEKIIQITKMNGSVIENSFHFKGDTLIIQKIENGKFVTEKYLKKKLAL